MDAPSGFQVRGYMIPAAAAVLRETAGEREAKRLFEGFSAPTRDAVANAKAAGWYPVDVVSEVFIALATFGQGNEDKTRELLIGAGSRVAHEATNTFLRLFIRMLSPTMLAKKVPDLWARDCTGGKLTMDVSDRKIVCSMYELDGFAHATCIIPGFIKFALETAGAKFESVTVRGWSLASPHTKEATCEYVLK